MLHCSCFIKIYHNSSSVLCKFRKSNTSWVAMDFVLSESSWHGSNFHATLTSWSSFSCPYPLMVSSQHPCSSFYSLWTGVQEEGSLGNIKRNEHLQRSKYGRCWYTSQTVFHSPFWFLTILFYCLINTTFGYCSVWSLNFAINWLSIVYLTYLSFMKLYALLYLSVCSILAPAVCF